MKIFKFNPKSKLETQEAVSRSIEILKKGGTIVHPTDTCYGIAADINNKKAIKKVYQFKGRAFNKPFFIIVRSITQFKQYGHWNSLAERIIKQHPRKMFTFVVPRKKTVPKHLNPDFDTIGMQMPKNKFSLSLLERFDRPVIGTSANLSNEPVVYSIKDLLTQLKKINRYPDLVLDAGKMPVKKPSRVIEIKGKNIGILRK